MPVIHTNKSQLLPLALAVPSAVRAGNVSLVEKMMQVHPGPSRTARASLLKAAACTAQLWQPEVRVTATGSGSQSVTTQAVQLTGTGRLCLAPLGRQTRGIREVVESTAAALGGTVVTDRWFTLPLVLR